MDLFKLTGTPYFINGQAINGYDAVTWVERYREPGEFRIRARLSSGLREFLPLGTAISHIQTLELMIVENHQISEELDEDPILDITGRSFDSFLEQRAVGQNQNWVAGPDPYIINQEGYNLGENLTPWQARNLINEHLATGWAVNSTDAIPNFQTLISSEITAFGQVEVARIVKRGNLHTRLVELLAIEDLGVKSIRPNMFPEYEYGTWITLMIHRGIDRRSTVSFSSKTGDVAKADYLWSNKTIKNAAMVAGKYVDVMVYGTETGYNRRVLFVDGSDIDGALTAVPTGTTLTNIQERLRVRGEAELAAQREVVLSSVDISENRTHKYRIDYDVGDIVRLDGNFGVRLDMRVIEYAEIVDENGESGQPTLTVLVD